MAVETLQLTAIDWTVAASVRDRLYEKSVTDYKIDMGLGDTFPPVTVFRDGKGKLWGADGRHTAVAAERSGLAVIAAEVIDGTRKDALIWAAKDPNRKHGLRRSDQDKIATVKAILAEPEFKEASHKRVADTCKVSVDFVSDVAISTGQQTDPKDRVNADGATGRTGRPKKAREPGDDTAKPEKNGQPTWNLKTFNEYLSRGLAELNKLAHEYGSVNSRNQPSGPEYNGLRRKLSEVGKEAEAWAKRLKKTQKGKANAECSKQQYLLEDLAPPSIPALDDAIETYVAARDSRMRLLEEEIAAHDDLRALMWEHNLTTYTNEDRVVSLDNTVKAKVKRKKSEEGNSDEE